MTLLHEKSAWDLTEKGNDNLKSGKYKKAIKYYDQALKIEPGYITALCGKGALESFFNHKNEAIVLFETALRINPEYTPALTKLAWNYNSVKRYQDAINCCNTALEIDPDSAEAWSIKGYAFYKLAKYSASLNCCHEAKMRDPASVHLFEKSALERKLKEEETIKNIQLKEEILKEIQSIKSEDFEAKIVKIRTALENPEKILQAKKDLDEMKIEIQEKEKNERNLVEKENTERKNAINSLNDLQKENERLIHKGVVFSVDLELLSDLINKKRFEEMVEKAREINDYLKLRENDYNSVANEIQKSTSISPGLQDLLNSGNYPEALQFLTLQKKVRTHVERELSPIHTAGFEKEVNNLYKLLDAPSGIFSVENELISLKEQIHEREIREDAEKALSKVQNLTESLQNDGLILNPDIFSRISLINERISNKQYELAQQETISLESDLSEYKSLFDKATQLIQTVDSDQIRQLYSKGEYQKTIEYCASLQKKIETLQTQVMNAEKNYKIPDSVKKVIETSDYDKISNALETLQKIQYSGQPKLSFSMDDKDYKIKISNQVTLTIVNSGEVHTRNVRVSFSDDLSIKQISPIPELKVGDSGKIIFAMVPNISGDIPLDITIECEYGSNNKHYRIKDQKWIRVFEGTNEVLQVVSPDPKPVTTPPSVNQQEELFRRYSEIEFKGQGSFAKVFKAKRKDGTYVAIKVPVTMDASTGRSFIAEIQNWTKLSHENIVRIYEYNILPTPYFEMELCDISLDDIKKPMDCTKAALIIFEICKGLEYAHSKKIIHRDLKPQNILLKSDIPKISDWGLSKIITKSASMTTTSYTPYYAAPEQINNKSKDERTDIWQLGVILYELTTGVLPFNGDTMVDVAMNIIMNPPKLPSEINPDASHIEPIIMKCLEKNPEKRYPSAIELEKGINDYLKDDFTKSLKESSSANDRQRCAQFCCELITISLKNRNISDIYYFLTDLVNYADGETKKEAIELANQLNYRMENNIYDIPDEFALKTGNIVHKVKYGFKNI